MEALNRRIWMSAISAAGAATASMLAKTPQAQAGGLMVDVRGSIRRDGVRGKMTGAQAIAASLECMGAPCVYGIPGPRTTSFGTLLKPPSSPIFSLAMNFHAA